MKNALLRLAYVGMFMITAISCDNNEDAPQETITFKVNSDTEKYWIALSDNSGKVLSWKALTNGVAATFTYAATQEHIMLTMISKSGVSYEYTTLTSYADVGPGDYTITSRTESNSGSPYTFVINRNSNDFNTVIQSEGQCLSGPSYWGEDRVDMSLCEDNTNLLLWCTRIGIDDDTPRYLYKTGIQKNGSLTLDMDLFNKLPEMKTQVIAYDKPFLYGSSMVLGNNLKDKNPMLASAYYPGINTSPKIKIYYPDLIGSAFASYYFLIDITTEAYVYNFISKEGTVPDASYPLLDVQFDFADSTKITPQLISTRATGKADYTKAVFQHRRTETDGGLWFVYAPFTNDISIHPPLFPEDLKAAAKLDIASKMKASQFGFGEDKGLGGYEAFYKANLNTTNSYTQSYKIDNRSKIYQLRPYVAIFGRQSSPENP